MSTVSHPSESVLYGRQPCKDRDGKLRYPKGMESFVIKIKHCELPVIIPVQLAVTWPGNLVEELKGQQMPDSSLLLVTAPKTGTHWMWETMSMLSRGEAIYREEPKHHCWLESKRFTDIVAREQQTPLVINTHQTLSQLPAGFRQQNTKVVVCMRNPKDVLVSLYYHFRNVVPRVNDSQFMAFDDMFDLLLYSKYVPFGRTLDHYADTWDNYRNDPNVLIVFYEDLKERTTEMVRLVADHMQVDYTNKLIDEVSSAIDITVMKKGKHPSEKVFRSRYGQDASLYRKGEIGDWKNHFSPEQDRKFDKIFKRWNRKRAIPFRFEPSVPLQM